MSRNALEIFQAEDPEGFQLLQVAAQMSRSEKVDPIDRLVLLAEISTAVGPYMIKAAVEQLAEEEKPKYEWRNGARVRVKNS